MYRFRSATAFYVFIFKWKKTHPVHGAPYKSLQTILANSKVYNLLILVISSFIILVGPLQVTQSNANPLRLLYDLKRGQFW